MKVYVVHEGEYSDRRAVAVFSSEEKANLYAYTHDGDVEEFEMDSIEIEGHSPEVRWFVTRWPSGEMVVGMTNYTPGSFPGECQVLSTMVGSSCILRTIVAAATRDDAIKKASDKFAMYQAKKEGV
jgi:hypothetical protein